MNDIGASLGLDGSVAVSSQIVVDSTKCGRRNGRAVVPAFPGGQSGNSELRNFDDKIRLLLLLMPLFAVSGQS